MATLYPSLKQIQNFNPRPTQGEWALVKFLADNLVPACEVYVQPSLNGDFPDAIIMWKGHGVCIIEVKDWQLDSYFYKDIDHWGLRCNNHIIRSPIKQVNEYKDNLYNYHIPGLACKKMVDSRYYGFIETMVYLHNATRQEIAAFFPKLPEHTAVVGRDELRPAAFLAKLGKYMSGAYTSRYFTQELYELFKIALQPTEHCQHMGKPMRTITKQRKIIDKCNTGKNLKIHGAAGSGKSLVLAKIAVDAYKRTKKDVLILTFNITLVHYISDLLRVAGFTGKLNHFIILNYHSFMKRHANNHNLILTKKLTLASSDVQPRYQTIIVDEVQDFEREWVDTIRMLLKVKGQIVFAGDEKQNIYERPIDKKKGAYTGIPGAWNTLTTTVRLRPPVTALANAFQKEFLSEKYEYEEIKNEKRDGPQWVQEELNLVDDDPRYYYFESLDISKILRIYSKMITKYRFNINDSCFIGDKISDMRLLDQAIRRENIKTTTTFETEEDYQIAIREYSGENLEMELKAVRSSQKYNFWMNGGAIKLSTIHSFKGWEISNLIMVLHDGMEDEENLRLSRNELIYTALTRCRGHLVIINIGNEQLNNFFEGRCRSFRIK